LGILLLPSFEREGVPQGRGDVAQCRTMGGIGCKESVTFLYVAGSTALPSDLTGK
jgi:hypothetical protein